MQTYTAKAKIESPTPIGDAISFYGIKEKNLLRMDFHNRPKDELSMIINDFNANTQYTIVASNGSILLCVQGPAGPNLFKDDQIGAIPYSGLKSSQGHIVNEWSNGQFIVQEDAFTNLPVLVHVKTASANITYVYTSVDHRPPSESLFVVSDEIKAKCKKPLKHRQPLDLFNI
jgi:hypothetical protein